MKKDSSPENAAAANEYIWINAGEASGDMHGALLARELVKLRPGLKIRCMGGPAMKEAGCEVVHPMGLISLMGGTEILPALPRLIRLLGEMKRYFAREKPLAVVLIDCPEFNFQVARRAHKLGIPVYYHITPQIWAWRSGRIKLLRKYFRKVLCIQPFEEGYYRERGLDAEYVGNPLLDQLPLKELESVAVEKKRVGILPGSRKKEISELMPRFAEAAKIIIRKHPEVKFSIVQAPGMSREALLGHWPEELDVELVPPENRYQCMKSCRLILAASGTVSLETALIGTPTIVAYRLSGLTFFLARLVVNVKWISLPNLILDKEIFPEFIQDKATPEALARQACQWLDGPERVEAIRRELIKLRDMVGKPGAPVRAAKIIMDDIEAIEKEG